MIEQERKRRGKNKTYRRNSQIERESKTLRKNDEKERETESGEQVRDRMIVRAYE
jgi:hypothetical protein